MLSYDISILCLSDLTCRIRSPAQFLILILTIDFRNIFRLVNIDSPHIRLELGKFRIYTFYICNLSFQRFRLRKYLFVYFVLCMCVFW